MKCKTILFFIITALFLATPTLIFAQVVEEETVGATDYSSTSYASGTATVGNYAIKFGPMGNIYIVDRDTQLDPGVGGFIAFDYRFHPNFSAEVGAFVTFQDGAGISAGDNNILFLGVPTFDLKYYFLSESRWDPYALLGFGFYVLTEGSTDNGTTAIGVGSNLGLGLDYYFTERISVGIAAIFRAVALIQSFSGEHNGSALFPFSMTGNFAFHF